MKYDKLRVWHISFLNEEMKYKYYVNVSSIMEAYKILNVLEDYDLFLYNEEIKDDNGYNRKIEEYQGLEYFDKEKGEWCEWVDEEHNAKIKEYMEDIFWIKREIEKSI